MELLINKRNLKEPLTLIAYADSDWAGNADNRRSKTGGVLFLGADQYAG